MLDSYRTVVVTGGAGFIGRHLVGALVGLGKDVVVVDNLSTSLDDTAHPGARLVRADVRSPQDLQAAVDGADLVFHLAANASGSRSIEDPRFDFETNVVGTFNVLEAAAQAGVRRVVYTSSASVYGIPKSYPMVETDRPEPVHAVRVVEADRRAAGPRLAPGPRAAGGDDQAAGGLRPR